MPLPAIRALVPMLCLMVLAACSPGRTVEAVDLLTDLADPPPLPEALAAVERQEIAGPADLYRATDVAPEAALVVVPGAAEEGRRDPRLVRFAATLADAGFLVLVPGLAGDDPLRLSAGDADAVARGVQRLTGTAAVAEVGLVGISYAAGPALLAALRPAVREHVGFVLVIGGYHDITAAITYMTTGAYRVAPGAGWRTGPVDRQAKWRFLLANAGRVGAGTDDAETLRAIARRRLAAPGAGVAALTQALGPEARAVWRLLSNDDPDRVPALIDALPDALRTEIRALDLSRRDLDRLTAEVILIHGRDDPMVPWTESRALAERIGPDQARLYVVDGLYHVDMGDLSAGDGLALLRAAYRLLKARDEAPAPSAPAPARSVTSAGRTRRRGGLPRRSRCRA
ncbi:alpha/beta fold hydrolase domain-containing protein [Caenispirillum salinarum]|uniref:alpha/beta hydrolase n=1 Tax=Caenispirillum salinarum TaxID=859058 RepID=UPI0006908B8A|nr:alpha/beta hydrolase [Caenispirillum salinarum]